LIVLKPSKILRVLRVESLVGPGSTTQPEWTRLLEAASAQPVSSLSLRLGAPLAGNLVTYAEKNREWMVAFAETASMLGIPTLLWVGPDSEFSADDAVVLSGLGVIVGLSLDIRTLSASLLRSVMETEMKRLSGVLGYEPKCLRVTSVDRLVLQQASSAGFNLVFRDGSGLNMNHEDIVSTRISTDPALESAWFLGRRRATLRVVAEGVVSRVDPKRFGL
jgi:hypothetical protein